MDGACGEVTEYSNKSSIRRGEAVTAPDSIICDVAVIGAGVIGCSVAYWLARRGLQVVVAEAGEIGGGASAACGGFISLQSKEPGPVLDMAISSLELWRNMPAQFHSACEFSPCGGMLLARDQADFKVLRRTARMAGARGIDVQLLSSKEAAKLVPALETDIAGATYCSAEAAVNPLQLTLTLARSAREHGALLIESCRVQRMALSGPVWALETSSCRIHSTRVVCCAGAWSAAICASLGLQIPVYPLKGQMLVTEAVGPLLCCTLAGTEYLASKHAFRRAVGDFRSGFTAEQTRSGNLLLGSTREDAAFDRDNSLAALKAIASAARRYMPEAARLDIIRAFAGLRPQSQDALPFLGAVPSCPGLYLATGHGGDGVALSLETGRLLAQAVASGCEPEELRPFSPRRIR